MKFKLIRRGPEPRLILIFAGWGMDSRPFETLAPRSYDLAVAWDYRDLSASWIGEIGRYREIAVVAWSFGVAGASSFLLDHPALPITARIAVNGTQHPVDDHLGIPRGIFNGTLDSLSAGNLTRFHRRMCGGSANYRLFAATMPERDVEELRDELRAIGSRDNRQIMWDRAFISTGDLIIPPEAQERAWKEEAYTITELPGPHLPDFGKLLELSLTDKKLVARKFGDATTSYDSHASVQRTVTDRLLATVTPGGRILEIGAGTGYATDRLASMGEVEAWDLIISPRVEELTAAGRIRSRGCDAETAIRELPDGSVDTLFSASTVQWFNSLPAFLREVSRVLRPGGHACISTFGPRTMEEIHSILGNPPLYPTAVAVARMVQEGEVTDGVITLGFDTPRDVLHHIRLTGVNSLGPSPTPGLTRRLLAEYPAGPEGKCRLTYQPVYITISKPCEK